MANNPINDESSMVGALRDQNPPITNYTGFSGLVARMTQQNQERADPKYQTSAPMTEPANDPGYESRTQLGRGMGSEAQLTAMTKVLLDIKESALWLTDWFSEMGDKLVQSSDQTVKMLSDLTEAFGEQTQIQTRIANENARENAYEPAQRPTQVEPGEDTASSGFWGFILGTISGMAKGLLNTLGIGGVAGSIFLLAGAGIGGIVYAIVGTLVVAAALMLFKAMGDYKGADLSEFTSKIGEYIWTGLETVASSAWDKMREGIQDHYRKHGQIEKGSKYDNAFNRTLLEIEKTIALFTFGDDRNDDKIAELKEKLKIVQTQKGLTADNMKQTLLDITSIEGQLKKAKESGNTNLETQLQDHLTALEKRLQDFQALNDSLGKDETELTSNLSGERYGSLSASITSFGEDFEDANKQIEADVEKSKIEFQRMVDDVKGFFGGVYDWLIDTMANIGEGIKSTFDKLTDPHWWYQKLNDAIPEIDLGLGDIFADLKDRLRSMFEFDERAPASFERPKHTISEKAQMVTNQQEMRQNLDWMMNYDQPKTDVEAPAISAKNLKAVQAVKSVEKARDVSKASVAVVAPKTVNNTSSVSNRTTNNYAAPPSPFPQGRSNVGIDNLKAKQF